MNLYGNMADHWLKVEYSKSKRVMVMLDTIEFDVVGNEEE